MATINVGTLEAIIRLRDQMTPALARVGSSMQRTGAKIGAIGRTAQQTGTQLTVGLSLPLGLMAAKAAISFATFEQGMNKVQALTGATADEFKLLTAQAKNLGSTTAFTAKQASEGMGFLAQAGFDVVEILGAMPNVLTLAASASLELGVAADITTNILTGFGRSVDELSESNDILVKAFTSANTNLQQLGTAFKFAGPVAKSAGLSFAETTATLALMGNAGIQASMAGTSLRRAITALLNPTGASAKAIRDLGLNVTTAGGKLIPFNQVIQQLERSGATTAQMMQIFGQRAGPAMAALVGQGSAALRELTAELTDSAGIAERIAKVQLAGLQGAFIKMKSAIEGMFISLGAQLSPALTALFNKILIVANVISNTVVPAFAALPGPVQQLVIGLGALAIIAGPIIATFGIMAIATEGALVGFGKMSVALSTLSVKFFGTKTVMSVFQANLLLMELQLAKMEGGFAGVAKVVGTKLAAAFRAAGAAMGLAFWPILLATAAVMLVIATGNGPQLLNFLKKLGSFVMEVAHLFGAVLNKAIELVIFSFTGLSIKVESVGKVFNVMSNWLAKMTAGMKRNRLVQDGMSEANADLAASQGVMNDLLEGTASAAQLAENRLASLSRIKTAGNLNAVLDAWIRKGNVSSEVLQSLAQRANDLGVKNDDLSDAMKNVVRGFQIIKTNAEAAAAAEEVMATASDELAKAIKALSDEASDAGLGGEIAALNGAFAELKREGLLTHSALMVLGETASDLRSRGHELNGVLEQAASRFDVLTGSGVESAEALDKVKDAAAGILIPVDAAGKSLERIPLILSGIEHNGQLASEEMIAMQEVMSHFETALAPGISTFQSFREAAKTAFEDLPNVILAAVTGGGDVMRAIGTSMGGQLGQSLTAGTTKLMSGVFGEKIGGALGGLMGPLGSMLGGLLGKGLAKIMSLFGKKPVFKQIMDDIGSTWGIAISESLAKEIEKLATEVGDRLLAQTLSMSKIITEAGGIMAFGFTRATMKAKDFFSMIDLGKASLDQIRGPFLDFFSELLENIGSAGAGGIHFFNQLIETALQFGVTAEEIRAKVLEFLQSLDLTSETGRKAFEILIDNAELYGLTIEDIRAKTLEWIDSLDLASEAGVQTFINIASQADRYGVTLDDIRTKAQAFVADLDLMSETGMASFMALVEAAGALGLSITDLLAPVDNLVGGMVTAATAAGGIVSAQFDDMIAKAQELGVANEEIAKFFASNWKKASDGMQAVLDSNIKLSKATLESFALAAFAAFQAAVDAGTPLIQALQNMQPLWDDLKERMIAAGLEGTEAFRQMNSWMRLATGETGELIAGILGMGQVLEGLANTGALTQRMFNAFGADVVASFAKMREAGIGQRRSLIAIQPTLQSLWEAQEKFGFKVDDATQKLIDQGIQAGIIGPKFRSAGDIMADAMQRVVELLEALLIAMGIDLPAAAKKGAREIESSFSGIEIVVPVVFDVGELPDIPTGGATIRAGGGFVHGSGGIRDFGAGTAVVLHGRERVQTEAQVRQSSAGGTVHVHVELDGHELTEVIVPLMPEALSEAGLI